MIRDWEKEEKLIEELNKRYTQFTFTTEYDAKDLFFRVNAWNGDYREIDLFLTIEYDASKFWRESFEYFIKSISESIDKKLIEEKEAEERKIKRIVLNRCECCGAPLLSLTCDYCGAKYLEV